MKILIKGYYGFGNFGDDLLCLFFYRLLKKMFPEAQVYVFSNATENNSNFQLNHTHKNYNQYLKGLLNIDKKHIIDWTYKGHFDVVINGGGGVFFDYTLASFLKKIINRIINLFTPKTAYRFEKIVRVILRKKSNITFDKNYAIGNNVGPFDVNSSQFVRLYLKIGAIDGFLIRDMESKYYLKKIKYKGFYQQISDVVYCKSYLPELYEKKTNHDIKTVGIILMSWQHDAEQHMIKFNELHSLLTQRGIGTRFFAFSELHDVKLQDLTENAITYWRPNEQPLVEYLQELSEVDCMISMRFHGLVVSNIIGIPCVGIGINNKITDYIKQTEQVNEWVDKDFIVNELIEKIELINQNFKHSTENIKNIKEMFFKTEQIVQDFLVALET